MTTAAAPRCRTCGFEVPQAAGRCPRCSAAVGSLEPCPHCRAEAGASPHGELRYVCDVCGGPRVPHIDRALRYGGREAPLLRKANEARKARAGWRAAAAVAGLLLPFTVLMFGMLLLVFAPNAVLVTLALLCVAPIAAFLVFALRRAALRGGEIAPALDAAWLSVAAEVAEQLPGITSPALAEKLGVEEAQAEELLALLDVNATVGAGPRVRIAAGPPAEAPASALRSAEEEAALAENAPAEVAARRASPPGKP